MVLTKQEIQKADELYSKIEQLFGYAKTDQEKKKSISLATKMIVRLPSVGQWTYLSHKLAPLFNISTKKLNEIIEAADEAKMVEEEKAKLKSVDDLITGALISGAKMLMANMFTVEGNAELNQLHINPIDKTCLNNLKDFAIRVDRGWMLLGVFTTHEGASEYCKLIREYIIPADDSSTKAAIANKL